MSDTLSSTIAWLFVALVCAVLFCRRLRYVRSLVPAGLQQAQSSQPPPQLQPRHSSFVPCNCAPHGMARGGSNDGADADATRHSVAVVQRGTSAIAV